LGRFRGPSSTKKALVQNWERSVLDLRTESTQIESSRLRTRPGGSRIKKELEIFKTKSLHISGGKNRKHFCLVVGFVKGGERALLLPKISPWGGIGGAA